MPVYRLHCNLKHFVVEYRLLFRTWSRAFVKHSKNWCDVNTFLVSKSFICIIEIWIVSFSHTQKCRPWKDVIEKGSLNIGNKVWLWFYKSSKGNRRNGHGLCRFNAECWQRTVIKRRRASTEERVTKKSGQETKGK